MIIELRDYPNPHHQVTVLQVTERTFCPIVQQWAQSTSGRHVVSQIFRALASHCLKWPPCRAGYPPSWRGPWESPDSIHASSFLKDLGDTLGRVQASLHNPSPTFSQLSFFLPHVVAPGPGQLLWWPETGMLCTQEQAWGFPKAAGMDLFPPHLAKLRERGCSCVTLGLTQSTGSGPMWAHPLWEGMGKRRDTY